MEQGHVDWDRITEIGEVMTGDASGRSAPADLTLYESHGMGIQDLYVAARMLQLARERGVGTELPIGA